MTNKELTAPMTRRIFAQSLCAAGLAPCAAQALTKPDLTPTPEIQAAFEAWRQAWDACDDIGPQDEAMMTMQPRTAGDLHLQTVAALSGSIAATDSTPAGQLYRRSLVAVEKITGKAFTGTSVPE